MCDNHDIWIGEISLCKWIVPSHRSQSSVCYETKWQLVVGTLTVWLLLLHTYWLKSAAARVRFRFCFPRKCMTWLKIRKIWKWLQFSLNKCMLARKIFLNLVRENILWNLTILILPIQCFQVLFIIPNSICIVCRGVWKTKYQRVPDTDTYPTSYV